MSKIPFVFVVVGLSFSGCELAGSSSSSSSSNPNDPAGNNITGQAAVQILNTTDQVAANNAANTLSNMPSDIGGRLTADSRTRLTEANATFRGDIASSPTNTGAKFGLAVTSLALSMDSWKDSLDRMWKNGLSVGTSTPSAMFRASPTAIVRSQAFAARSLQTTDSAATIRELQNTVELHFLPTVDSVRSLLLDCWNDPEFSYRFPVSGFGDRDSLTIGHADVGLALASVMAVRSYLVWLIAQDLEVGFPNQGFPTQYAWLDTLSRIDIDAGPVGEFQNQAFLNLKALCSGTFMGVRAGHLAKVQAIPADLITAAGIAKSAAQYSYLYQRDFRHGLVRIDSSTNSAFALVADSVRWYLSAPRDFKRAAYREIRYLGSSRSCIGTTCEWTYDYDTIDHPAINLRMDLAKMITMPDRKVFLPNFRWNEPSQWAALGPFSLTTSSGTTTSYVQLGTLDVNSATDLSGIVEWKDPTFGGVFPTFTSTRDVLSKLDELNENSVTTSATGLGRMMPLSARF